MYFSVVMYGCKSWTIKKAEHQRTDACKLCCWRRVLRVPWTARRCNQSMQKDISPEYLLEGLMLKLSSNSLATWCKEWLIGKIPSAERDWRQEEKGMTEDETVGCHHWLNEHEFDQGLGVGDGQGSLACCSPRSCKNGTLLTNWTDW